MSYTSLRAFSRALGRDHTTVRRWIQHEEWTLPRRPPWTVEHVHQAYDFCEEWMDEDRGWRGADRGILAPGKLAMTWEGVAEKLGKFLGDWGEAVRGLLTVDDLAWLARLWNAVLAFALADEAARLNWPNPYKPHRPASEWAELAVALAERDESIERIGGAYASTTVEVLDARYGRERWLESVRAEDRHYFTPEVIPPFKPEDDYIRGLYRARGVEVAEAPA